MERKRSTVKCTDAVLSDRADLATRAAAAAARLWRTVAERGKIISVLGALVRIVITAIALFVSTLIVPGIELGGETATGKIGTLLVVALLFGVVNGVLKPIIQALGCGFYILTLGLIALVVNALLFLLVGTLAEQLSLSFDVTGFWAGFFGAIVVALVSFLLSVFVPDKLKN
jgi:putative membrane protein